MQSTIIRKATAIPLVLSVHTIYGGAVDLADLGLLSQHVGHIHPLSGVELPARSELVLSSHPNPFNPCTTISYEIPTRGHVLLRIFDLYGRLVMTLIDEEQGAGRHEAIWAGRDARDRPVAAGVYIVLLESAEGRRTGKLAIVK